MFAHIYGLADGNWGVPKRRRGGGVREAEESVGDKRLRGWER